MPLRVGLTYTQMKMGRAKEHIDELQRQIVEFRKDPYTVTPKDDLKKRRHVVRIETKVMPDLIGLLAGEFAFNLRSGLDHLAWQLALLTTDTPSKKTLFPIHGEEPGPKDNALAEKIANVPLEAAEIIKSLQPYHRGTAFKDDSLWQLNKLCNVDKHRVIAVSCTEFAVGVFNVVPVKVRDLDYGKEVIIPLFLKDKLKLEIQLPEIVFGEPIDVATGRAAFEITIDGLNRIYNFVRYDVVPRFERFFPK